MIKIKNVSEGFPSGKPFSVKLNHTELSRHIDLGRKLKSSGIEDDFLIVPEDERLYASFEDHYKSLKEMRLQHRGTQIDNRDVYLVGRQETGYRLGFAGVKKRVSGFMTKQQTYIAFADIIFD